MRTTPSGSPDAVNGGAAYVQGAGGRSTCPAEPVQFKTKKSAQDAHEAIRPYFARASRERGEAPSWRRTVPLYELIWNRFIACRWCRRCSPRPPPTSRRGGDVPGHGPDPQFPATSPSTARRRSKTSRGAGPEKMEGDDEGGRRFPPAARLEAGAKLELIQLIPEQHFTPAAPRSRASAGQGAGEKGIGRPRPTRHPLHHPGQGVRGERRALLPPTWARSSPEASCWGLSARVDVQFHRADGRGGWRGRGGADRVAGGARRVSTSPSRRAWSRRKRRCATSTGERSPPICSAKKMRSPM